MIDPTSPRQLAGIDLGGSASGTYDRARRTSVILVAPHRVSPARLLIAEPTGVVHDIELTRILDEEGGRA